jgi:general secretion pathway protein A
MTDALHVVCEKIRFTLDERQGLSVVYGEVGTGKSTLMRHMVGEYSAREDCTTIPLYSPKQSTELGLLKAICGEFDLALKHSRIAQESELREFLIAEYRAGRNCCVFVDEAQLLKGEVLELVRTLLNFETDSAKLINLILFGQLELRDRLKDRSKKALRSRIFLYSVLEPLTVEDTEKMIRYRLERARVKLEFEPEAVRLVFQRSKGIPRAAMRLCGAAFLLARGNGVTAIDAEMVGMAADHVPPDGDDDEW